MNSAGIIDLIPSSLRQQWKEDNIYPDRSVYRLFAEQAQRQPGTPAVLVPGQRITYAQLHDAVLRLAGSFRAMGIVAGDVVAYQLSNSWHCSAIDLAVAALGAVVAPFPPGRGRLDIESLLKRCDARAFIINPHYTDMDMCQLVDDLRPTVLSLRFLIVDGAPQDGWHGLDSLLQESPLADGELPEVCADTPVRLLVSSGTESEPKLVAYSHNALVGGRGRFLQRLHPDGASFRGMYLVPLGSSFGSFATFGVLSWLGGSIALLPQFDVPEAIRAIEELRPTHLLGVPTMFQRIAAHPTLATVDKSSLRAIVSGGSVIDQTTIQRCVEVFGCRFVSLYGSADGVNCHNTLDDPPEVVFKSVGRPNPSVCEIRIVDNESNVLPSGTCGEIVARGPLSPMQYVNAPELDAKYRDKEGWVHTGDLGYLDAQGYLILAGRKKDIIVRGGANISPVQIENIATSHPGIVESACIAVPDADLGQRVCICLTVKEGSPRPSLEELNLYFCQQGLETSKLPDYLCFYRNLPLSPAGKVDKKRLAAELEFVGSVAGTLA
ncbi:long-chain fatty acid--CoA ligase [Verminephrobacter aporrectodeae subsp. tuberculatae]|uniref:Long-chain fatty acid--CoA ligase n=2 Tax=Verminephrobacter TaxID=364316 RepID=A0ABT3KYL5_9BURK|nr:long-chain fatty acid--CoA ligase [Verminephrobacter aporrectodeae subsp. tuberculatae]MCW8198195.1 long-chain fatty acid--CoA ligase [Verminephrobacter aporrectodeae subsp. tuberculatae]